MHEMSEELLKCALEEFDVGWRDASEPGHEPEGGTFYYRKGFDACLAALAMARANFKALVQARASLALMDAEAAEAEKKGR